MIRKFIFALALFILVAPGASFAASGLGDKIPHDFSLKNQNGEVKNFDDLSGQKGVVVFFVRSADWCPYCQVQMLDLRDQGKAIEKLGYKIVTISYDKPEVLKKFTDKNNINYTMLSDVGSVAIKDFGILNGSFDIDHFAYGVPEPHVYIISKNQAILGILSEEGYKKRPQIEAIVETIKALD